VTSLIEEKEKLISNKMFAKKKVEKKVNNLPIVND
jgi:hypothetical protein